MKKLRLFEESFLAKCSKQDLERKLAMVQTNSDLTREEVEQNRDRILFALNGGVHYTRQDVLDDIKASEADISDWEEIKC